jgi:hypothetical protein
LSCLFPIKMKRRQQNRTSIQQIAKM